MDRPRRTPFLDNTKLLLLGIAALVAALAALLVLANRSSALAPDVLADVVLYALSATNLTMLVALVFVLARNILKQVVERRRGLPFSKFRAKLVGVLLGMTLIPAVLVLLVGSELIRNNVDRWFNADLDEVLASANDIAGDYYEEQRSAALLQARLLAGRLAGLDGDRLVENARVLARDAVGAQQVDLVEVYLVETAARQPVAPVRVAASAARNAPTGVSRVAEALVRRVQRDATEAGDVEPVRTGGEMLRAAVPVRGTGRPVSAVVVASRYLTGDFARRARSITTAFEGYQQLRVLRRPIAGVYLSFFLMLTLMILVSATWMGLYLAKRITRPIQLLATAANEIGAGRLDHRIEAGGQDEFGSLIEAFNRMASELLASRQRLERSAVELEAKHQDVEGRRRYVETVLDRIGTGVMAMDAGGNVRAFNSAASRLLGFSGDVSGMPLAAVLASPDLKGLAALVEQTPVRGTERPQDAVIVREGREVHLTVAATRLTGPDGGNEGVVLVFDDVTPLVRAQRAAAWREVARRLAHEIKNPLTPIQLCAERLKRHFADASEPTRALVDECAGTIVGEVESLKGLVDEFSQFARMPAPRMVPSDLNAILDEALGLYRGLVSDVVFVRRFGERLPRVSVDPEQLRRVVVNLVDNAVEATERRGTIIIETAHDPAAGVARIMVSDDGPGIPAAERDKLFLPYYSTKLRGSGLGLAIVRRIVVEHGGTIDVTDHRPRGTCFTIELPA